MRLNLLGKPTDSPEITTNPPGAPRQQRPRLLEALVLGTAIALQQQSPSFTSAEVGRHLGLSPRAVRRHLERLRDRGDIALDAARGRYGGTTLTLRGA